MNMTINFSGVRHALACALCLAVALLGAARARGDQGDPPEVEASRLVHLLGYIAADYGGAVENGVVVSQGEYDEQLALATEGARIAAQIQPALDAARAAAPSGPSRPGGGRLDLAGEVGKIRELLEQKGPAADVAANIDMLRSEIVGGFRIEEAPPSAPDTGRAARLYAEHCATCHGESGRADTARAATLTPRPVNFHDPERGEALTAVRVTSTIRFGVPGTAMVPFTFLTDEDRWDLAFFVAGLRHAGAPPAAGAPAYTLAELAARSDAALRGELRAIGIPRDREDAILADLRRRAPYEDRAGRTPLGVARLKLDRVRVHVARGDRDAARSQLVDAYLEGIEPAEAPLRAADAALARALEERTMALRGRLEGGALPAELDGELEALLRDITRAEALISPSAAPRTFASTALSSAGIILREGVEAALLVAALLGLAAQAGLSDRRRFVHLGWATAILLGVLTWFASSRLITVSGARRELIEGATALLATIVLFYVSYSLLARREVARWMRFLKEQISPRKAALSLFGVSLLAAYREAFETVLFFQALLASDASPAAALVGAGGGAVVLVVIVAAYTRAGRFAPPQLFFRVSSYLLYGLAVVFAGQGVAALQMAGAVPVHPVGLPSIPALGLFPTLETLGAQLLLLALAALGVLVQRRQAPVDGSPGKPGSGPRPPPEKPTTSSASVAPDAAS